MKTAGILAFALLLYGVVLHTYTHAVESQSFSIGWWLWSLAPYIAASLLFLILRRPHATVGALVVPAILDGGNYYSVFINPESSTAALGLLFVPLWNLVLFVPIGAIIGWWIGRRSSAASSALPTDTSVK